MKHPMVKPPPAAAETAGAYAAMDDLIRLQFKAQGFSFLPRQPVHSLLTGRYASRLRGRGLNFEEIRGYLPGDDIRSIDWKVTARTRQPHTRVYTEERDRPALLVVDQRLSMFFGSRRSMKSVTAAELAALSAWRVVSGGDRVGAVVFNDSELREIRPHRSRQRVMQILQTVVAMNHALRVDAGIEANPAMLNQVLENVLRLVTHDYLVCVISDFSGADAESRRLLTRIAHHNDVLVGLIYDPLQTQLPAAGRVVVSDGDLQLELDSGDTRVRRHISEYFNDRLRRIQQELSQVGVPVLLLSNAEGVAEQLRHQLSQARQPRRA